MKFTNIFAIFSVFTLICLSSCLGDEADSADYSEWRAKNEKYIDSLEILTEGGKLYFEKVSPNWDKNVYVLMHWHNDRSQNVNKVTPLSTSTLKVKYTLTNISGDTLDSSASFTCVPNNLVTGFWTAVTNMNVKDTVTAVIPYYAGYGTGGSGKVLPYSTLIFGIRLDSIYNLY